MKILISNDNAFAHMYIRMGWQKAFTAAGHDCVLWDINKKSCFDAMDEFPADLLITQSYNVTEAMIKCIEARPFMKVIMKGSDFGPTSNEIRSSFPILYATPQEIYNIESLRERTGKPDFLYVHYPEKYLDQTHGYWREKGFKVVSMLNGADLFDYYNGQYDERLATDLSFVGGMWGYKGITLNKWLMPLCNSDYKFKIFGNQPWSGPCYCGFLGTEHVKNLFASSKICPNIHEPHSQALGWDIVERPFKILSSGGFCISDHVDGLVDLVPEGIVYATSPSDFKEKVDYYLKEENQEERLSIAAKGKEEVLKSHTYFDRTAQMLNELGLDSSNIMDIKERILK